jgi:23S rRNA (adenine2503-C2)-methyltransferase
MQKKLIKNYSIEEVIERFKELGEKEFRARQLFSWMYSRNAESFEEMTVFSKDLRAKLSEKYILSPLVLEDRLISGLDATEKYLFKTHDGHYIESVLIKRDGSDDGKLTICISSQAGCAMGCSFCETAKIGFIRDLEVSEIIDQINHIRRVTGLDNNNIVFMGMGEPFMNYERVIKAATIINYSFGFHISSRRITISTCGVLSKLERYIDEGHLFNLALSVNDTESSKRLINMPVEKKYPISKVAEMLNKKFPVSRSRLTLEYVMRSDNITKQDAVRLKKLFHNTRIKLNLIPLNSSEKSDNIPTQKEIETFLEHLKIMNVPIIVRKSCGQDINGACGQLSGKKYKKAVNI